MMTGTELPDENQMQLTDIDRGQVTDDDGSGTVVCVIVHEPTRGELASAIRSCLAHASQIVSGDWVDAADRAEIGRQIATGEFPLDGEVRTKHGHGLVFGINSDRGHVDAGVADVDRGPVTDVVVDSIETLGETHSEIRDRVDTIVESGADLHLNDTGVVIDSESSKSVLGVLDSLDRGGVELQRAAKVQDVRDWLGSKELPDRGRAPLGFTYDDGELVTAENYDEVRAVLSMVLDDDPDSLSQRKAAENLDVAPRTIGRALDSLTRYGLDEDTEE